MPLLHSHTQRHPIELHSQATSIVSMQLWTIDILKGLVAQ